MLDRYHSGLELQFGHLNTKTLMQGQTLYLNQITRYISDLFDFGIFVFALLTRVNRQINQNFGGVRHFRKI